MHQKHLTDERSSILPLTRTRSCNAVSCTRSAYAFRHCKMHYEQERRRRTPCAEPGCPTKAEKLSYCRRHERRALEKLDKGTMGSPVMDSELDRLARFLLVDEVTGCWIWNGPRNGDYASVIVGDREWLGHRLMYVWFVGGHAPRRELDHVCNTTLCMRPNHLQPVTHRVNAARRARRSKSPDAFFWTDDYLCKTTIPLLLWAGKHGLPAAPSHWDSPERSNRQSTNDSPNT